MTPQRWRQVKEICGAVLDHAPEKRDALLAQLCSGDAELKREVEGLLEKTRTGDSILDGPVWKKFSMTGAGPLRDSRRERFWPIVIESLD
jgi:hypothetical protein